MTSHRSPTENNSGPPPPSRVNVPIAVAVGVGAVLLIGGLMMWRAEAKTNKVALATSAKPVSVIAAKTSTFRPSRTYIGTLEPWVQASVGPQLVSAYVDTVLVRPGASVRRGEVVATLDCRNASSEQQAVASQARAIDARQKAMANESARTQGLLDGGFVSPNEAEQKMAQSTSELAQLEATKAKLASSALEVNDCILRAPFDGEIARRAIDPGAFVRPGAAIVTIIDRGTVRMTADAPEIDFDVVAPGTKVTLHVFATKKDLSAVIARRAPSADLTTRTVHFEIDVPDPKREIPVGTTGEVLIDVGEPSPATEIPIYAATLRGPKASLFVIEGDVARAKTIAVKGESGGRLYLDPLLPGGALVVAEGRALLDDGDHVTVKVTSDEPTTPPAGVAPMPSSSSASASAKDKQP